MKWDDIPTAAKMTATAVPVLAAAVIWMFATFETATGADQKWQQHEQAITCRTVYEMKAEIRAYLKELQSNPNLTPEDRDWIRTEIAALQADIQRLDPNGKC